MIPLAERRLAQVSWVDATNVAGGWHDAESLDEWAANGAWEASNTGWIVYEDDSCYVLAGRMTDDGVHVGLLERIPKRAVTGIVFPAAVGASVPATATYGTPITGWGHSGPCSPGCTCSVARGA